MRGSVAILTIGILLLGAVFGRFFKVWILVPASAVTFIIVFASSAYYGQGPLQALLEFAILATCLQIGYMTGLLAGATLWASISENTANHRVRLRQ